MASYAHAPLALDSIGRYAPRAALDYLALLLERVEDDAEDVSGAMATLTGMAFEGAYIGGQIHEYQQGIVFLDTHIPDVQSPELRTIATELRNTLVRDLVEARLLRSDLIAPAP